MTQPDPNFAIIRTALSMSRHLASSHPYHDLEYFYTKQIEAMAALDRLEVGFTIDVGDIPQNGNGRDTQPIPTPVPVSQPITQSEVEAALVGCST